MNASALTETAINLQWEVPGFGDCTFVSYQVEVSELNDKTGKATSKPPRP